MLVQLSLSSFLPLLYFFGSKLGSHSISLEEYNSSNGKRNKRESMVLLMLVVVLVKVSEMVLLVLTTRQPRDNSCKPAR